MKFWLTLLLMAVVIVGSAMGQFPIVKGAESDLLLTDPNRIYADFPDGPGILYKSLLVTNSAGAERTVTISWDYYTGPVEGEILAPESWFTFSPNRIMVPTGLAMLFTIGIDVPDGTLDLVYKAYLKVDDGLGYARHVVLWVRVGESVPSYEFSITCGLYDAELIEPGVGQCELPNFGIRNTGTGKCEFRVFCQLPSGDSDPGYEIAPYKDTENGIVYDWVKIDADIKETGLQKTVKVPAYTTSWAKILIEVPEGIPNGKYKMWIGVRIAEDTGTLVSIGYASKVRLTIDRPPVGKTKSNLLWTKYLPYIGGGLVLLVVLGLALLGYDKWKNRDQAVPEYRGPYRG